MKRQSQLKKLSRRLTPDQRLKREERLAWRRMLRTMTDEEITAMANETRALLEKTVELWKQRQPPNPSEYQAAHAQMFDEEDKSEPPIV
jgi:hypothetical protein